MSGKGKGKRSNSDASMRNGDKKSKHSNGAKARYKMTGSLCDTEAKKCLRQAWLGDETEAESEVIVSEEVKVIKHPFTCCSVNNLVDSKEEIEELILELQELEFKEKNNDLYKFKQSGDLKDNGSFCAADVRSFLLSEVRPWLQDVTDIELNDEIALFCARYDYTDYLLCHDDELEGRRIAFIWYLVPKSWREEDGGALELFDRDAETGEPFKVVKSLVPHRNAFAFFEVTPKSFHQVAEVLTRDKTRLTIGGWFHGTTKERDQTMKSNLVRELCPPFDIAREEFFEWVNPMYMDEETQQEIKDTFKANSEISLSNFLAEEKYEEMCAALRDSGIKWSSVGPANMRSYDSAEDESLPEIIQECISFLRSDAMFVLLSTITGLRLHHLVPESDDSSDEEEDEEEESGQEEDEELKDMLKQVEEEEQEGEAEEVQIKEPSPKPCTSKLPSSEGTEEDETEINPLCHYEVRRWKRGSYTLIRDGDDHQSEFALDARLFFNCKDWNPEVGGYTSYVARDEDEELLTAEPEENALNLVYRDRETLKFVKRVTDEISQKESKDFHDISVVYFE